MSRVYRGTPKGDIAYMQPPAEAIARAQETAVPGLVVSPELRRRRDRDAWSRSTGPRDFAWLTDNAVNYSSMLQTGFEMLTGIVERCGFYRLTYSNLDEAIGAPRPLHRRPVAAGPPRERTRA